MELDAATNSEGQTALHIAAQRSCIGVVRLLVENGANLDVVDRVNELTPLHYACGADNVIVARHLLASGADPNLVGADGDTPLAPRRGYRGVERGYGHDRPYRWGR